MEGSNGGDETLDNLFLFTAEYEAAAIAERIRRCQEWLEENPGHTWSRVVQIKLEGEQSKLELEQSKLELEQRSLASVRTYYPKLLDRTDSAPYWPTKHKSAKVKEESADLLVRYRDAIEKVTNTDGFWKAGLWAAKLNHTINCDSEDRAQRHVVSIVESVLIALKLDNCVEAATKRTIVGTECDVLLIYKPNRLPFSCIEVKKPGKTPEDQNKVFYGESSSSSENENLVAGELFDECKAVGLFGFEDEHGVIGMVATGNHWRLASTRPLAIAADDLISGWESLVQQNQESGQCVDWGEDADRDNFVGISPQQSDVVLDSGDGDKDEDSGETDRILYASSVVPALTDTDDNVTRAGEQIVQLVVLYVLHACSTLARLLKINEHPLNEIFIRPKMPCRVLTNNNKTFSFSTVSVKQLQVQTFPPNGKNTKRIHVIHPIGSGEYGDCCLGVSDGGASSCAIKFFHKSSEQAENERRNWEEVYGQNKGIPACFTWAIAGQEACLVMPYLTPIPSSDRRRLLDDNTIRKALEQFASTGYIHIDIKWRHFGWWKETLILLDLGLIKKSSELEIVHWVEKSLATLVKKASGVTAQQLSTPKHSGRKRKGSAGSLKEVSELGGRI